MKLKRMIACLLTAATLAGLLVAPVSAASKSAFTDIADPVVAEAAELLRLLGVVDGTGGTAFNPGNTLSRAEFCKMTVEISGWGDEEPAQRNRTIFLDVGPTHWARGYINLASSKPVGGTSAGGTSDKEDAPSTKLISGVGDGNFQPDRKITYGEAATILMRVLGYGNSDVATGSNWYDGFVSMAKSSGLADGLTLNGASTITRGQAAQLFYNLLFTKAKGATEIFLTTLEAKKIDGGILLSVDTTASDGTKGAVKTTTGTYKTDRVPLDAALEGMQGELVLDKDGKLLAFQPKENLSKRAVSVSKWAYNKVTLSEGEELSLLPEAVVYQDGEKKTYKDLWQNLTPGTPATFYYTNDGKVDYLFLQTVASADSATVARAVPNGTTNPFAVLTGGQTGYTMYKNGIPATVADLRQYDVGTYDKTTKVMNVSDLRLTGMYENVYPNTETPATVTVMGATLNVLPSAANDLKSFKIGDIITLLLTRDGQVAGVVSTSAAKSTAVGVVTKISESDGQATVELLNDVLKPLSGTTSLRGDSAKKMQGQLVIVSSYSVGQISIAGLGTSGAVGTLDVAARKLGSVALAENVKLYERIGAGTPVEITFDQLTRAKVPASQILYAGKDYAGKYNILVFDDVTGDLYTYGYLTTGSEETGSFGGEAIYNPTISVKTDGKTAKDGWKNEAMTLFGGANVKQNSPGGLSASLESFSGSHKLAGYVTLTELKGVRRAAFDMDAKTVTTTDMVIPISGHVVCYNKTTKTWFPAEDPMDALNEARAYSDSLTLYYDKAPEDGGKVRLVVVE